MGKLFIVSTPIGNLGDITYRAVQILKSCDVILAEDTRSAITLLKHYELPHKEIISFFEGNEEKRYGQIVMLLSQDKNVALISESGTPLISDPGFKLIRSLVENGIEIIAIPGPTAAITALTLSGLPTNAFLFFGFLPKKHGKVKKVLEEAKSVLKASETIKTVLFYESPHRLLDTLQSIESVFGDIEIVVARELTKIYEEVRREKVSESITYFTQEAPRGEFTILFSKSSHIDPESSSG